MDILIILAAFITAFFFVKMIFHLLRYMVDKLRKKDISLVKKKVKKSGIVFAICYVVTIMLGVMAGDTENAYTTASTESNVKEERSDSVADLSTQEDEKQEEYGYEEYDEFVLDADIAEQWEENEYTIEEMEEKASTYTTLLTYTYENTSHGKKIKALIEDSQNAKENDFCYVLEKSKLTSAKKTYEMAVDGEAEYIYFGKIKKNKPDGYGILYHDRYPVYIGEFNKGVKDGYGIEIVESDLYNAYFIAYEGEFKDGLCEGDGTEYREFVEGTMLDSYYYALDMYCKEVLKYMDLRYDLALVDSVVTYKGEFRDGKYNGDGTSYYGSGQVMYEGDFESGAYNGKGNLYYGDGQIWYEGEFENGKYDGKGTLYTKEGDIEYKGKFKNGDIR